VEEEVPLLVRSWVGCQVGETDWVIVVVRRFWREGVRGLVGGSAVSAVVVMMLWKGHWAVCRPRAPKPKVWRSLEEACVSRTLLLLVWWLVRGDDMLRSSDEALTAPYVPRDLGHLAVLVPCVAVC
jgi:hypothetical protein